MSDNLKKIADAPEFAGSAADNVEMVIALSGKVEIAGREFPAPAAAVVALLDAIESPFVADTGRDATSIDIFRAIYLIAKRSAAALPVLRLMRMKEALEKAEADLPEIIIESQKQAIIEAEADLDVAALAYCEGLGQFNPTEAARDIGAYLSMATGFSMLPHNRSGDKKKQDIT